MTNNLEIDPTDRIHDIGAIVGRMILRPQARRAVISPARLQSRSVELFDLFGIWQCAPVNHNA